MKKLILLFALLFLFKIGYSQITFEKTYGGDDNDYGSSVLQTNDGGYVIVGNTGTFVNDSHVYLIRLDENGDSLWTKTFGGDENCLGFSIKRTIDNGFIITGQIFSSDSIYLYLIKTDEYGDSLWTKKYGGIYSTGFDVELTDDDGYIITGQSLNPANVYLIKTNFNGDTIWTKTFNAQPQATNEEGSSISISNDGGYVITGSTETYPSSSDIFLVKTDVDGEKLWSKTFGSGYGSSVKQAIDGGYIITGTATGLGNFWQIYVIKTDENGDTLWTHNYGGIGMDSGAEIQLTSDGNYIICGQTDIDSVGNNYDVYLLKIDENGNELWSKTYGNEFSESGNSVFQTSDDGYVIAGEKWDDSFTSEVYVIKTDEYGLITWTSSIRLPISSDLIVTPNPFNTEVEIKFNLVNTCEITLSIYNQIGQITQTLYKGKKEKGIHQLNFNLIDLNSGIYFIKLQSGQESETQKIIKR